MRCLALALGWKRHVGEVIFITACRYKHLIQLLRQEAINVVLLDEPHPHVGDLSQALDCVRRYPGAWMVIDGYHFGSDYHKALRQGPSRLLLIDDHDHLDHYHCDLLLNQNVGAEKISYAANPDTKMLLGPRYALLRPEFHQWIGWPRQIVEDGRHILVTLGGSDPPNATGRIMQALEASPKRDLEVKIVLGSLNAQKKEIQRAADNAVFRVTVIENAQNMAALMQWADLAISSGGSTCYELCFMQLPFMTVIIADNQEDIAINLDREGVSINLGWHTELDHHALAQTIARLLGDPVRRARMSNNGSRLVDGSGVQRVVEEVLNYQ